MLGLEEAHQIVEQMLGSRVLRVEDHALTALDAQSHDGQHRGAVDPGAVGTSYGDGDAGGGDHPAEVGGRTGVEPHD